MGLAASRPTPAGLQAPRCLAAASKRSGYAKIAEFQGHGGNPMFDIDQVQSRKTRRRVLDQLEADGSLVSAGHFPDAGFGRFVRVSGRRVWQVI